MIEEYLKKWIQEEIESEEVGLEYYVACLTNDDDATDIWKEFAVWHSDELRDLVRVQIRAILKEKRKIK